MLRIVQVAPPAGISLPLFHVGLVVRVLARAAMGVVEKGMTTIFFATAIIHN